ncbi:hypothetical protein PENTCL1PPCAC_20724, partial [Pristionchus entomophagus]
LICDNNLYEQQTNNLLRLSDTIVGGLLGLLLSLSGVLLVGSDATEVAVHLDLLLGVGDSAGSLLVDDLGEGKDGSAELSGDLELFGLAVSLLGGGQLLGEEDELSLVSLQTLNVGFLRLEGLVSSAVVNRDSDSAGIDLADAGLLELIKGESTSEANASVVSLGDATDGRSEETGDGTRGNLGSLSNTGETSALLAGGLVEPGLDSHFPMLAEVRIGDHVVPLGSHGYLE